MDGVKKICKTAIGVMVGAGLICFVKGLCLGYLICHYKNKWHSAKCTDKTDKEQE
ncbi:hypothetical protein RG963_10550 [Methanosarcina sp. Z-7115]|uniref:Uncharacterized protein n=1 Tax=Methanosarcina baikalica TaxID=3073890 RepID=A0ABU2D2P0_9EURY|nr:hypothetical protein [Methanosarcina sp. Z-7115]MDR7666206.1 hypothetical protein [Methanosarcina sp. Z-7115]